MDLTLGPGELERLRTKFPNTVCVFAIPAKRSELPPLDKHKYIVPKSTTMGQFLYILRKRMQLPPEKALFCFIENMLPTSSQTVAELYALHKSADGVLRVTYTSESTFGFEG